MYSYSQRLSRKYVFLAILQVCQSNVVISAEGSDSRETSTCQNFFTVLATGFKGNPIKIRRKYNHEDFFSDFWNTITWSRVDSNAQRDKLADASCTKVFQKFHAQFLVHSEQMSIMGSHLHVFTTWNEQQLSESGCSLDQYDHISMVQFDPEELFKNRNFSSTSIQYMKGWGGTPDSVTRLSDMMRLAIAATYGYAYTDTDMVYLSLNAEVFLKHPNMAAPVWNNEGAALELQNSGFCFSSVQLRLLISWVDRHIASKGDDQEYFYTEMGPSAFHNVVSRLGSLSIYTTCHPLKTSFQDIKEQHIKYQFVWLHLDGLIRRQIENDDYVAFVRRIREEFEAPTLELD